MDAITQAFGIITAPSRGWGKILADLYMLSYTYRNSRGTATTKDEMWSQRGTLKVVVGWAPQHEKKHFRCDRGVSRLRPLTTVSLDNYVSNSTKVAVSDSVG